MVLSPIGASSVQEDNFLVALAALLIEDLSFSQKGTRELFARCKSISQTPVRLVAITSTGDSFVLDVDACWMLIPNPAIPFAY